MGNAGQPSPAHLCPQFERLTSRFSMAGALQELKSFLEIDPHLPSDSLPLTNWKHKRGDEHAVSPSALQAWPKGRQYKHGPTVQHNGCGRTQGRRDAGCAGTTAAGMAQCGPQPRACLLLPLLVGSMRGLDCPPLPPEQVGRYWNMTRSEYQHLISLAERNTRE